MMNKARITYRFDPNGSREEERKARGDQHNVIPLYEEEFRVVEEGSEKSGHRGHDRQRNRSNPDYQLLNQYSNDYEAWNSPYDAETRRIEELIRESNERRGGGLEDRRREKAREPIENRHHSRHGDLTYEEQSYENAEYDEEGTDERRYADRFGDTRHGGTERNGARNNGARYDGETGYFDPDPAYGGRRNEIWEGPIVTGPRYVRHSRPPWLKIAGSIAGAAVTGVLLGFLVLSMFNDDGVPQGGLEPAATETAQEGQAVTPGQQNVLPTTADVQNGSGSKAAVAGKGVALDYTGKTYAILQNGSFAAQQGADQAKSDLQKKGLAAVSEQADKVFVYVGVAADRDSALALSQRLKDDQVEIYVKNYQLPSLSAVYWNGKPDTLKNYLEQSDKQLLTMSKLTLLHLGEDKPASLDAATMQSVSSSHAAWAQLSSVAAQEAGEAERPLIQKMNNAMNSAKASLDEYRKNPSAAMLWQTQTYIMQFILGEKALLEAIQA